VIARLAWRLRRLAVDAHPSNGDKTMIQKVPLGGVYLSIM
jgi:hypothetical protein